MEQNTTVGNEILTLCVGKCGLYLGNRFYSTIMREHHIDKDGTYNAHQFQISKNNTYFKYKCKKYIPRACFIDIDNSTINHIQSSQLGTLIETDNFISDKYSQPLITWAKGYYTEGAEFIDNVINKIRMEIETCDNLQGFNMIHSISGGTGSGLGTLILVKLRDNYPDKKAFTFTIYPSTTHIYSAHNHNFHIYNSILAIDRLIENTDLTFNINNDILYNICKTKLKLLHPTFEDINWCISLLISGITSTFRFYTEPSLNTNLKSMYSTFTIYPRLHFLASTHSPFFALNEYKYNYNISKIIHESWSNVTIPINYDNGLIWNYATCFRSYYKNATDKMNQYLSTLRRPRKREFFCSWNPNNVQSCVVYDGGNNYYSKIVPLISTSIIQTTAMKCVYQYITGKFAKLYKRKSYLYWYKNEGMDEMEFEMADKNIRDLITEYQDKQGDRGSMDYSHYTNEYSEEDDYDDDEDDDEDEDDISES
eukprot:206982_1